MAFKKKKLTAPTVWLTVYGDWVTNLTLFFILLFYTAMAAVEKDMTKEDLDNFKAEITASVYKEKKKLSKFEDLKEKIIKIKGVSGLLINDNEIRIRVPDSVLFNNEEAVIKEEAKEVLDPLGEILSELPYKIIFEGHAYEIPVKRSVPANTPRWAMALARSSGKGPYLSNWELSAARTIQVIKYYTRKSGPLSPERLIANACGGAETIPFNIDEEYIKSNCGIEIRVQLKNEIASLE